MNFWNPITMFFAGLFLGWIIEWFIDHAFWRQRPDSLPAPKAPTELETELADVRGKHSDALRTLSQRQTELEEANQKLSAKEKELKEAQASPETSAMAGLKDQASEWQAKFNDLQAKHDALLAAPALGDHPATAELEALKRDHENLLVNHQNLLAKRSSDQPPTEELATLKSSLDAARDEHSKLQAAHDQLQAEHKDLLTQQKAAAKELTAAEQAALQQAHQELSNPDGASSASTKELEELKTEHGALLTARDQLKQELEASRARVAELEKQAAAPKAPVLQAAETLPEPKTKATAKKPEQPAEEEAPPMTGKARRDPFQKIEGVGPIFERRLWENGIFTFAQLAGTSVSEVEEIIKPEKWQKIEPQVWIREAGEFARGERS